VSSSRELVVILDDAIALYTDDAEMCGQEGDDASYEEGRKIVQRLKAVQIDIQENYHLHRQCTSFQVVNLLHSKGVLKDVKEVLPRFISKIDEDIEQLQRQKEVYNKLLESEPDVPKGGFQ